MNASRCIGLFAAVAILGMATALPARATSSHTWVSGLGNDSNAGTAQSPYATFATALTNTSVGGMVSVADSGDFGACTIMQSVTIEGMPGATITFTGGEGIYCLNNGGDVFVIRNLTINGLGVGTDAIYFACNSGSSSPVQLEVDNCTLTGFTSIGIGVGDEGIMNLVVRDTMINGGTLGVRTFQGTPLGTVYAHVHLYHCHISNASSAGVFTRNGTLDMRYCEVTDSLIGIENDTSAIISADSCVFSNDATAVACFTSAVDRLSNNDIWDCPTGISAYDGGSVYSDGTNRKGGLVSGSMPPNYKMSQY